MHFCFVHPDSHNSKFVDDFVIRLYFIIISFVTAWVILLTPRQIILFKYWLEIQCQIFLSTEILFNCNLVAP